MQKEVREVSDCLFSGFLKDGECGSYSKQGDGVSIKREERFQFIEVERKSNFWLVMRLNVCIGV